MPFDDIEDALRLANDSPYGLGASVWSNDLAAVHRMVPRIKSGSVWVNCHSALDPALPFGGYKMSGLGREMGAAADITIATVPGALEAPLTLQAMAKSGRFDALVALGAVIRGETYHFELVSNEQGAGITRVTLDTGVPIANGILTTEDDDQALSRMQVKGADCAQAAVEMARLLKALA